MMGLCWGIPPPLNGLTPGQFLVPVFRKLPPEKGGLWGWWTPSLLIDQCHVQ